VRDVRALDRKVASLEECIREEVEASGTTLTEVFGVGSILAAKIIGIVGDVGRFPVSLAGNRRLNLCHAQDRRQPSPKRSSR